MKTPNFILPKFFASLVGLLPRTPPEFVLVSMLNMLLKHEVLADKMPLLVDKKFAIDVLDAGLSLHFAASANRFALCSHQDSVDLRFAANIADFAKIAFREEDPDTLFFNRRLMIEGDTELGLIVKNLLDSIDWSRLKKSPNSFAESQ